jgi:hypothetical protein
VSTLLIFPSCTDEARRFYLAQPDKSSVLASSSVNGDPLDADYVRWRQLPSIRDPQFTDAFATLVKEEGVTRFFSSLVHVHEVVKRVISQRGLAVTLLSADPLNMVLTEVKRTWNDAGALLRSARAINPTMSLTLAQAASVLFHFRNIYGESREDKLAAFMACLDMAPKGDVVEIGALMGKSSFALGLLARFAGIGPVLVVDPFEGGAAVQEDLPPGIVERTLTMSWDTVHKAFLMAVLALFPGEINYLRKPSVAAHPVYAAGATVITPEFGSRTYAGRIAFLHVDGNHDFEAVRLDCALWLPHLAPGGWVCLDDYTWLMGDGPRRVGDELLVRLASRLDRAFVQAGALFLKLR